MTIEHPVADVAFGLSLVFLIAFVVVGALNMDWLRLMRLRRKYKKILWAVAMRTIESKKVYVFQESGEHWFLGDEDVEAVLWVCVQHKLVWRMHQYPELTKLGRHLL